MGIETLNDHMHLAGGWSIFRRYLVMNAFDGILTVFGVVLGSYLIGITEPRQVYIAGLSAAIAIGVSGIYIAYLTEQAEHDKEQKQMEKKLLMDLSNTKYARAKQVANVVNSGINGISPFFFGALTLVPFFLVPDITITIAYYLSFGLNALTLFVLGLFLGKIAQQSMVYFGIKTLFAGVIVFLLIFLTNYT